jgi:hypothetical protein
MAKTSFTIEYDAAQELQATLTYVVDFAEEAQVQITWAVSPSGQMIGAPRLDSTISGRGEPSDPWPEMEGAEAALLAAIPMLAEQMYSPRFVPNMSQLFATYLDAIINNAGDE